MHRWGLGLVALTLVGCVVRKDIHQAALDAVAEGRDRVAAVEAGLVDAAAQRDALNLRIEAMQVELDRLAGERDTLVADNASLRAQLDDAWRRLNQAGVSNDALVEANAEVQRLLADSQQALADARRRQAEADARDAVYRRLRERLQAMIDAGKLNVRIVRGRMVIDLKQDILFPSGKAILSELGVETLREVAAALAEFSDRSFQVEGHTDNVPIKTDRFPSNWDLSTARAVSVVTLFAESGLSPERLSAAGFGEFQPRADNGSPEGRALNRRIEIVMLPDLQLLPDIVESLGGR